MLLRDLLSETGSIYVHCDWRVNSLVRLTMDEVFGRDYLRRELIWNRGNPSGGKASANNYIHAHDTLLFYIKSQRSTFNKQYDNYTDEYIAQRFINDDQDGKGLYRLQGSGDNLRKQYLSESKGKALISVWTLPDINVMARERLDYPTQKPEALLERIIKASSNEGDLVLDCFCGSGTTAAVAEKLGRKWIAVDLGRYAIHTTRKRLIGIQREQQAAKKPYRSFDVYNLGRYERQWWQMERLKGADTEHRATVLKFFRAAPIANSPSPLLHGTRSGAYVYVDNIDSTLTGGELREVAQAAASVNARELICLAWEFEMDLRQRARALEAEHNLKISLRYIPREIMEANRDTVQFFEAGYLEAKAVVKPDPKDKKRKVVDVELVGFAPSLAEVPEKELTELRERAVKSPFDFIDFWAVDFEFTDGKAFEHHWQDYRTRKDRALKTVSDAKHAYATPGKKRICVKVIDVFGVDTTTIVEVTL